jgi:hypothetical protein
MDIESFWDSMRDVWFVRPLEVNGTSPLAIEVSEDDLWQAVVAASERCGRQSGAGGVTYSMSLAGSPTASTPEWVMPQRADKTLDDYLGRVDNAASGSDWSCAFSGLQWVSAPLWDRAAQISEDLYREIGARPCGRSDVDIFMGHYQSTKVGVHQDFAHNMSFTLRGPKRLLTWPSSMSESIPERSEGYDSIRDRAVVLSGSEGGMTYFPPEEFHIGESPEAATAALNFVNFEIRQSPEECSMSMLSSLIDKPSQSEAIGDGSIVDTGGITYTFDQLLSVLSGGAAYRAAMTMWLESLTSFRLQAPRPRSLAEGADLPSAVALRTGSKLVFSEDPADASKLFFASDGYVQTCTDVPEVRAVLNVFASDGVVRIDSLHKDVLEVVRVIWGWGSLVDRTEVSA